MLRPYTLKTFVSFVRSLENMCVWMSYRTNSPNTRSNRSVPSYPRKRVSRL